MAKGGFPIRSQMLYPIELWVLTEENFKFSPQKLHLLRCFNSTQARPKQTKLPLGPLPRQE